MNNTAIKIKKCLICQKEIILKEDMDFWHCSNNCYEKSLNEYLVKNDDIEYITYPCKWEDYIEKVKEKCNAEKIWFNNTKNDNEGLTYRFLKKDYETIENWINKTLKNENL